MLSCSFRARFLRLSTLSLALTGLSISVQVAPAQPIPGHPAVPPSGAFKAVASKVGMPAPTALGPGDVLTIVVQKHPEFSVASAVVGTDGKIQIPVVSAVSVLGKTVAQIDAEIEKGLRKRLLHPEVTVSIQQLRARRVTMQGAVDKPSNYDLAPGWRVSDAIAAAGGLRLSAALTSATLTRPGSPNIVLNLPKIIENDAVANIELRPDDRLNFVSRTVTVQVAGQVNAPGPVTVPVGQGVLEALSLAGGAKPNAALSQTSIQRGTTTIPIDLYAAITLRQKNINRPVQEGDLILVPEATGRVSVTGAVAHPGFLDVPDGRSLRISEAFAQAGGAAPGAALTKTIVTRADGKNLVVDLYSVTVSNDQVANILLQPGDLVTVPQARGITVLGTAVTAPGTYVVEEGSTPRVSDALARAGGLKVPPDSAKISITRMVAGGKQLSLEVDPVLLIDKGDAAQNARIYDGDFVFIGSTLRTVYINGVNQDGRSTVKAPGVYEVKSGDGVRELLARAGGVSDNAALSRIQVQRAGKVEVVNALSTTNKGAGTDFQLQTGDNVIVPALEEKVNVTPGVNKAGLIYLPEDRPLTVGDAVALAGGPVQGAKIKEIAVYRISADRKLEPHMVSLDPSTRKKGYNDLSMPLQNGDYVFVPPPTAKGLTPFQQMSQALSPLVLLGRLF